MHGLPLAVSLLLFVATVHAEGAGAAASAGTTSVYGAKPYWPVMQDRASNMGWADFDQDGDADVALAYTANSKHYIAFYRNEGAMQFNAYTVFEVPKGEIEALNFDDVNGDGYPDLQVIRFRGPNNVNLNDGTGLFESRAAMLGLEADRSHAIAGADIDSDGDTDLVVANAGRSKRYLNDGKGGFSPGRAINRLPNEARSVVTGDIDGDGDTDVLLGTHDGYIYVHKNRGDGVFDAGGYVVTRIRGGSIGKLLLIDMDDDGDLDLFAADRSDLDFYRNKGDGTFDPADRLEGSEYVFPVDVDHDGDLDIVTYPAQLFLNRANGQWQSTERIINSHNSAEEALQDIDNDGDLDIVLLLRQAPGLKAYLNNSNAIQNSEQP